jgi:hypothetical protein
MDPFAPYQTELVKIADRLAGRPEAQDDSAYLRRFRTIYRHLATSVVGVSIESGMLGAMGMGMPQGFPQPSASELLQKTDDELDHLAG